MKETFAFHGGKYILHAWYLYVGAWLIASLVLCYMVLQNRGWDAAPMLIMTGFSLLVTVLVLVNRLRCWKKSKLYATDSRIEFVHVLFDGYAGQIYLGQQRKIRTYTAVQPFQVTHEGGCVVVRGDVFCVESKYNGLQNTRKERRMAQFKIPPYFENWDQVVKKLSSFNGGR